MEDIATKYLILDITTNLSRIGRFALEGNEKRVRQFTEEIEEYIREIDNREIPENFKRTYKNFKSAFVTISNNKGNRQNIADDAFTYSNILTHRATLLGE